MMEMHLGTSLSAAVKKYAIKTKCPSLKLNKMTCKCI